MAWSIEYKKELDELMANWQAEIKASLLPKAPGWNSVMGVGKSPTVLINDKYKELLDQLKERHGVN